MAQQFRHSAVMFALGGSLLWLPSRSSWRLWAKWTQDKETIAMLQRELAARQNAGGSEPRSQSLLERLNITPPQQPGGQMPGGGLGVGGLPNYSGGGAAPNQLG